MQRPLESRTIIVTGAVGGLGCAIVTAALQAGGDVVCLDLPGKPPNEIWKHLTACADQSQTVATYYPCDVTNEEDVKTVVASAQHSSVSRGRPIRGLVASAGIQRMYDALDFPEQVFRQIMDINVTGSFLIAKHTARLMKDSGLGGSIILLASMAGYVGSRGVHGAAYCASKAATHALCRALAAEWGAHKIRVNSLSPGPIQTDLLEAMFVEDQSLRDSFMASNVLGRLGAPSDVQAASVFFLGDGSAYVTGTDLLIDGGACTTT